MEQATVGNLSVNIGAITNSKQLVQDANQVADENIKAVKRFQGAMGAISTMSLAGITAVGVALLGSARSAIAFEDTFAGIRKTVEASEQQFQSLAKSIQEIASVAPMSAGELNRIGELGGQLGVAVGNLPDFIKTVSTLAVTTNLTVDGASLGLARLDAIAQTNGETFDNLASTIVDLGNNFAATESEIMTTVLRIAQAAAQVGATTQDALAFATALQAIGVPAQAGGTAVARVFQSIQSALIQAQGETTEFGRIAAQSGQIAADGFDELFGEDPARAVQFFIEGLNNLNSSGDDVISRLDRLGLSQRRTTLAILGLAEAGDLVNRTLDTARSAFDENTAATEEALKKYGTLASQLQITKNIFNELGVQIGNNVTPLIQELNQTVQRVTLGFLQSENAFNALKNALKVLGVALAATITQMKSFQVLLTSIAKHPIIAALYAMGAGYAYFSAKNIEAAGAVEQLRRQLNNFAGDGEVTAQALAGIIDQTNEFQNLGEMQFFNADKIKEELALGLSGSEEEVRAFKERFINDLNLARSFSAGKDILAQFNDQLMTGKATAEDIIATANALAGENGTIQDSILDIEDVTKFVALTEQQRLQALVNADAIASEYNKIFPIFELLVEAQQANNTAKEKALELQAKEALGLTDFNSLTREQQQAYLPLIEAMKEKIKVGEKSNEVTQDMINVESEAETIFDRIAKNTIESAEQLFNSLDEVGDLTAKSAEEINKALADKIKLSDIFDAQIQYLKDQGFDDVALEFSKLGPEFAATLQGLLNDPEALSLREQLLQQANLSESNELKDALFGTDEEVLDKTTQAGKDYINGYIKGIEEQAIELDKTVQDVMLNSVSVAEDALGIQSPSAVTKELGKFIILGFVEGLQKSYPTMEKEFKGQMIDLVSMAKQAANEANSAIGSAFSSQFNLFGASQSVISSEQKLNDLMEERNKLLKGNTAAQTKAIQDARDKRDFLKIAYEEGTISLAEYQLAEEELAEAENARSSRLAELDKDITNANIQQAQNLFNLGQQAFQLLSLGPDAVNIFKDLANVLGIDSNVIDTITGKTEELANTIGMKFSGKMDEVANKFFNTNMKIEQEQITIDANNNPAITSISEVEQQLISLIGKDWRVKLGIDATGVGGSSTSSTGGGSGGGGQTIFAGGGRLPAYANGGTLASGYGLVGEYGPEIIRAIPGGGVDITPIGNTGSSSINISNLNVNVTGVPSDPMQARKAALAIRKELSKLDREGLIGTGIRGR